MVRKTLIVSACGLAAAVIAAAIEDAEGIPIIRMPISPSELYELRHAHSASKERS